VSWTAYICVQSGTAAGPVPGAQGWLQHETTITGDYALCTAEVSSEFIK